MNWLVEHLLGVHLDHGAHIAHIEPMLRGGLSLGWMLFLALLLVGAVVWMYHLAARHLAFGWRYGLAALRSVFLLLLLLIIARPVLQVTLEGSIRRTLLILVDGTKSMTIHETRTEDADLKRAAIGTGLLDPEKGLDQPLDPGAAANLAHITRLELLKSVLTNDRLNLIKSMAGDFDVHAFRFGQDNSSDAQLHDAGVAVSATGDEKPTVNLDWVNNLTATAPTTAIGDAIEDALSRTRGQPMAGIFLITDGQNNSGTDMISAAQDARQAGAPIFAYGVGLKLPRDVIVGRPFAPDIAFVDDEVPVTVRVRSQALAGQSGVLTLSLDNQTVDQKTVAFGADDESVVDLKFTPHKPGEYTLTAEIPPRPDEAVQTNNKGSTHLRVIDGKIKVLYIEQAPRWEFKYIQALLLRDRRVSAKFLLIDGDPSITQGDGSPYLSEMPSRTDLLKYDMIILGDVDPNTFTSAQMTTMSDFVSQFGGGFVSIAGKTFNPHSYVGTPIEKMLPVDINAMDSGGTIGAVAAGSAPIQLEPTETGLHNALLRLTDRESDVPMIWKTKLAPIYWDARVGEAKPAADVLAVDPDTSKQNRYGKMPVLAMQQYGVGQVLYVGTDNLWRWRRNSGEKYYQAFWSQVVQRLALPHLLGGSKRVQLRADKDIYSTGEKVTIDARLYDRAFAPINAPQINGYVISDTGEKTAIELRPTPDQPGNYRAQFPARAPGHYRFALDMPDDPEMGKTQLDLNITEPRQELEETAMNEAALREVATVSGGQFFREEDLYRLPQAVRAQTDSVRSTVDVDVWSSPLYFLLLMSVVICEWVLRKVCHMK